MELRPCCFLSPFAADIFYEGNCQEDLVKAKSIEMKFPPRDCDPIGSET